ncbi:1-acyl-sn-glycerol-3-phosphate acyltransferase [hydrothermal vent metagenome]|uniref:1-acyl-sn-glycerol-3-phosphate acyltransferase n=1 Tax=hydrothermal vent metagenome TaxID=652676 RepID=A0A1W1C707_9ZZZZ
MIPGLVVYAIFKPFVKEPRNIAQSGAALSYKLFYLLAPNIVLKPDLLDDVPTSAIYISTHQSILDFPALTTFIKRYLIFANVNLSKFPIVAKISHMAGVRYIKGRPLNEIADIYKELEIHLDNGNNVIYFPEGTRHEGDKLLPFKRGAFRLAKKKNKPIVPIVIEGASKLLPRKSFCFRTSKSTNVYMKMLPPLYPKDFKNEVEMMQHAQKIMQEEKDRLCALS